VETWTVTEARRQLPSLLDKAQQGRWQLIGRRNRRETILADADEVSALLGRCYRFHPEVVMSKTDVGLWLPELDTHAVGATLDEALQELADSGLARCERGTGYFVAESGPALAKADCKKRFFDEELPRLFKRMDELGIGLEEITSGYASRRGSEGDMK